MKLKKWLSLKKAPVETMEKQACHNCGHEFQGHYCPSCGQSITEFDLPVGFVFYDFLGNFFSFDSRFFKTFFDLLFKPGFLTAEFFKGRRARYAPPFRVFIFLSFVLFLLLQIMTTDGLNKALEQSFGEELAAVKPDSLVALTGNQAEVKEAIELTDSLGQKKVGIDFGQLMSGRNLKEGMDSVSEQLEDQLAKTTDQEERMRLKNMLSITRSPEQLVSRFLKYLSWAFFILLPVFALILKLFYIRRKVYYIRHLVFSVHLHSFMFLIMSMVVAANILLPNVIGALFFWLLIAIPVYVYLALYNFYGQGVIKTFFKFLFIGGVYNIILLGAIGYVFIDVLGLF